MLLGIDPGPELSGYVLLKEGILDQCGHIPNESLLTLCYAMNSGGNTTVIEKIVSYGRVVGQGTLDTAYWSGRFAEAAGDGSVLMSFKDVKAILCGVPQAKNPQVQQAAMDHFPATGGGSCPQKGTKKKPGPLYGLAGEHARSALAVAVAYHIQTGA